MDPNKLLARLLELAQVGGRRQLLEDETGELLAGVRDLDDWLVRGGFWPERWAGRGVNLKLANDRGRLDEEIDRVRSMFTGQYVTMPSKQPRLIVAVPFEPEADGRIVAGFATHAAYAADPATAVRLLREQLEETLRKVGQA